MKICLEMQERILNVSTKINALITNSIVHVNDDDTFNSI
jgi:hypothetical protein